MISWRSNRSPLLAPNSATRARRLARYRAAAAAVLLALLGVALFAAPYAGEVLVVTSPVADPDAIVSLASKDWERLPEAARLATQYASARVLLTLPVPATEHNCHDCGGRVARLAHLGVDPERVRILPLSSEGTYGEALACREIAQRAGIRKLLVVTSPYHTRRALAAFRRAFTGTGVEIGVQPASAFSEADPGRWWRAPYDRWYVRYEWLALAYYSLRYRIDPFAAPHA